MSGNSALRAIAGVFTAAVIVAAIVVAGSLMRHREPAQTALESASYTQPLARIVFTDLGPGEISLEASPGATKVELTRELQWRDGKPPRYTETWEGRP